MGFKEFKTKYIFKYILKNNLLSLYIRAVLWTASDDEKKFLHKNGIIKYVETFGLDNGFHWGITKDGTDFWYQHYANCNREAFIQYQKQWAFIQDN